MQNAEIAQVLSEMADLLELTGGNPYKARAYRQGALVVETLAEPVASLAAAGTLGELPGIGTSIAAKIVELLETGRSVDHDKLAQKIPPGVVELLRIEGIGPKTTALVWKELRVSSVEELEKAALDGRLEKLPRMGPLRVKGILEAIQRHRRRSGRMPLFRALPLAEGIVASLRNVKGVIRAEIAGSLRRRKETVGDLDILASSRDEEAVMEAFAHLSQVTEVIARGPTKCSVRLRGGLQADLRVLAPESFGAALHYFTGSKAHSIGIRTRAQRIGLKVNEYGIFDAKDRRIGGEHEQDVFDAIGLPWIPPELREGTGEVEAAERGALPKLIEEDDIVGDLHVHSEASSDGHSTLEEIYNEGHALGRHYIAVTDHSRSRPLGLDAAGALANAEAVRTFRKHHRGGPHLMTGIEVDILADGGLDLPLDVLSQLDWVVASIHSRFHEPPDKMSDRMIRAIRSGVVDVIGHPTGRLLGARDGYELDFERVLAAAKEVGVAMEVNAQPDRMDLNDGLCRLAKQAGVRLVISTDAHVPEHLSNLHFGLWMARRGWLTVRDVLNATDLPWQRRARPASRARASVATSPPHGGADRG